LLVDDLGPDAGTERQIAETVTRLNASRFEVHVCCFKDSERLEALSPMAHTRVFPLDSLLTASGLREMTRFRRYVSEHGIQVAHAWMVKSAIFGVLAGLGGSYRTVTSRLNTGYWYTPAYIRLFRFLNRHTTRIFANSEGAKRIAMAAEGLPASKIDVIYNGVDIRKYGRNSGDPAVATGIGIPADATVVGIVANLRPVKDLDLFLRAAALVAQQAPKAVFAIVGQGPLRAALANLVAELGLEKKVFFADGRGIVPDYLRRMSIGCLSSKSEGFSNAILEYMAAGLPVVATDVGGNGEAVSDGVTGYLVRERTPAAFAAPILRLLECERLRHEMSEAALIRCHERFSIETYAARMERFYADAAAERS
jgi:glycosyltransferase involved in cell wall biosynthesis